MNKKGKTIALVCLIVGVLLVLVAIFAILNNKTYTITFDTDGGSSISSIVVKSGERVSKPSNPTKVGYEFINWNYNGSVYDFTSKVKENMTLKAVWSEIKVEEKKYVITFELDGKTETLEVSSSSEIDLSKLSFTEKDGYVLKWYVNGKEYDMSTPLTGDVTLEGKYIKSTVFTVIFNSDGGTKVNNQTVKTGEKVKEPTNVTKEGYVLDGWYLNNKKYDFNNEVTKNITLVAKWKEDPNVKRYEVKFNSDGGSNVVSQKVIENKTVTKPKNPTKYGYAFEGWYLNNKEYNFNTKVTENITLVAKWRKLDKYTVMFDSNGGSNVTSKEVFEGEKVAKPTDPTKSGYIFKEWQLNGKKYDFNSVVTENITLKAVWEEVPKTNYTVTFNSDGGSNVASQTVVEGGKVTKPIDPTKSGYTFKEWQLNGKKYDFNSAVTGNITLKAVWEEVPKTNYTVTFNSDGGSNVASQTVVEGGKVTQPADPTKSHYNFVEWRLNGKKYDFNSVVTGNITLKAAWVQKTFTIKKTPVDNLSLDVRLTVYEEGKEVSFKNIMYNGRVVNSTINANSINGITAFQVTLNDGTVVTATVN